MNTKTSFQTFKSIKNAVNAKRLVVIEWCADWEAYLTSEALSAFLVGDKTTANRLMDEAAEAQRVAIWAVSCSSEALMRYWFSFRE